MLFKSSEDSKKSNNNATSDLCSLILILKNWEIFFCRLVGLNF